MRAVTVIAVDLNENTVIFFIRVAATSASLRGVTDRLNERCTDRLNERLSQEETADGQTVISSEAGSFIQNSIHTTKKRQLFNGQLIYTVLLNM